MPRLSTHLSLQDPRLQTVAMPMILPATIATAGNVTYTPAQLMSGMILRDGNGGARTVLCLPRRNWSIYRGLWSAPVSTVKCIRRAPR
jgi:hypothetical protein